MKYSKLGRSNLTVSRICLGTMHFGGPTSEAEAFEIMDAALDMGITFFDTANIYGGDSGPGATEEIIGNWLSQGGGRREKIVLGTKVYWGMVGDQTVPNEGTGISAYKVRKHLADSLRRLQTDYIDLLYVHCFDPITPLEETIRALEDLIKHGKVRYIGISNFKAWQLMKAQGLTSQLSTNRFIAAQYQYSLVNRDLEYE
ncbi:MAG: aldo/keto reductase, partial [Chloroflexota bacterium]